MGIKRLREDEATNSTTMADRLSDLPESLQLRIMSSLETKHVVPTSMLSKSWVSTWTNIPVLNFNSYSFKKLRCFDKFVYNGLSRLRESPVKLERLTFKRDGTCSAKILKKVIDYAFSHGVRELEATIVVTRKQKTVWPVSSNNTSWSDSLTSLTLSSHTNMTCPFLGPTSSGLSFKNLKNLYLRRAVITDVDPFSGFPALEKLTLDNCALNTRYDRVLDVNALQLSELTVLHHSQRVNRCELTTPKLRYFNYHGVNFPQMKTLGGDDLPILDILETVIISYGGFCLKDEENVMFDDLLLMFSSFRKAKSLTLFSSVVHILSSFQDELANRCSPFRELKCLKLDFSRFFNQKLFKGACRSLSEAFSLLPGVKDYLLQKSQGADCVVIYPIDPNADSPTARKCEYSIN